MHEHTTAAPSRAVPFETLPLVQQARYLRRHEPDKAVAIDLAHDGRALARMFFDASAGGALDGATSRALHQWAQLIVEHHPRAVGR